MSAQYHLSELRIALDSSHPAHILPPALPRSHRVLEIGCGAGQILIAAYPDRVSFGLDVDLAALKLGGSLTSGVRFVCGKAEALPFPDEQFDIVIARASLPYTNVGASLKEMRRVLRNGGRVWLTLHSFSIPCRQAMAVNYKAWILFGYVVINSALFHLIQRQFPLRGKYESFQTERGIARALAQHGFEDVSIKRGTHFLVTAAKRG
jgi:ubiquinone/menaquinone biosynthesis C-methylase UbiE